MAKGDAASDSWHKDTSPWQELLARLRRIELRIRIAVSEQRHGDFHAIFRGNGLEFDDLRAYNYGDEVRSINWKVSAKGQGVFVNTYTETREQQVALLVDVSASQGVGAAKKLQTAKEIAGVLALAAARQSHDVGLVAFSDRIEEWLPCRKGDAQALAIIKGLFSLEPESPKTSLKQVLKHSRAWLKRKSLVILISDFLTEEDIDSDLATLAHKHDLVILHLGSKDDHTLAPLGLVQLKDSEEGHGHWLFANSHQHIETLSQGLLSRRLSRLARAHRADYRYLEVTQDFVPALVELFNLRNRHKGA